MTTIMIIVGVIAYLLLALAAVAFINACERGRKAYPDRRWEPEHEDARL